MANVFRLGASVNIGVGRERQEDLFQYYEVSDTAIICCMIDGSGSREGKLQPSAIIWSAIREYLDEIFENPDEDDREFSIDVFMERPEVFLRQALINANRVLGAFHIAQEEFYSGYSGSITLCLLEEDKDRNNRIYLAHCGNTRLYLLRNREMKRITADHTKAAELLSEGKIDEEQYYIHPDNLKLTSGLGVYLNPEIQLLRGRFKDNDLIVMTTDGVHYAIRPEAMATIILESGECEDAADNLIRASLEMEYPDNCSAAVIRKKTQEERTE